MITIVERDRRTPHGWGVGVVGGLSACAAGDLEAVRRLASEGWAAAHAVDKHWNTALQWAAGGGHLAVVRWLVEDMKVDVDAKNKVGRTALMWACKAGSSQVASYLLNEADADASLRMKDDSTAFDWAVRCSVPNGHSSVQQMISLSLAWPHPTSSVITSRMDSKTTTRCLAVLTRTAPAHLSVAGAGRRSRDDGTARRPPQG